MEKGVEICSGATCFQLELTGWGYGEEYESMKEGKAEAKENRIEYRHGRLKEWYINGPPGA